MNIDYLPIKSYEVVDSDFQLIDGFVESAVTVNVGGIELDGYVSIRNGKPDWSTFSAIGIVEN
jgi:hypothetical protein